MLMGYHEKRYTDHSLRFEGISGPTELRDGHDYYTVRFEIIPALQWSDKKKREQSCSHGQVQMRYSDFEEMWTEFKGSVDDGSAEFPEKDGIVGRLGHLW